MKKIKELAIDGYPILSKILPIFNQRGYHNYLMSENGSYGMETFNGRNTCGLSSMIMGLYMRRKGFPIYFYYFNCMINGKNMDHIHVRCDKWIIDPTWRQFFDHYGKGNIDFLKYLYHNQPYCYVGSYWDLHSTYYGFYNMCHKDNFDNIEYNTLDIWKKSREINFLENNHKYEKIINKHLDRMGIETVIQA